MLGSVKMRDLHHPVLVSLETLVPQDSFYRRLDRALDLSFVREWVKECYADVGRPENSPQFRLFECTWKNFVDLTNMPHHLTPPEFTKVDARFCLKLTAILSEYLVVCHTGIELLARCW